MEPETAKWEKLPEETSRNYEAFCHYRDAGPSRSLELAYNAYKGNPDGKRQADGRFTDWSRRFRWVERVAAYDAHLELTLRRDAEETGRKTHKEELAAYRRRQLAIAQATQKTAIRALNLISDKLGTLTAKQLPIKSLPSFIRATAAVAESSSNAEAQALAVEELLKVLDDRDQDGPKASS